MRKRLLSWFLTFTMILSLMPPAAMADDSGVMSVANSPGVTLGSNVTDKTLSTSDISPYEISTSGTYRVNGNSKQPIIITADAGDVTLVLDGVNIQSATSPIQLQKSNFSAANVTLVVPDGKTATLVCTSDTKDAAQSADVAGKTAGINVPDGTTLTIDRIADETGSGVLNITGGYGGAGIGGNMGVGYVGDSYGINRNNSPITDATQQTTLGFGSNGGVRNATQLGFGGAPGRDGQSAEKSGTVTINSCSISITATAGAGIGGGQGATGENGVKGNAGLGIGTGTTACNPAMGSGGGGAGGNGGRGGDCGSVTINGGILDIKVTAPTATSGQQTTDNIHQVTPRDKIQTVGIGGGPGGWGGLGAEGGPTTVANGYSPSQNYNQSGYGGHGGNGQTGYVNYGGIADSITINGGIITVRGVGMAMGSNINEDETRNQAGEQSYAHNYLLNSGKGLQGGGGGGGGTARALTKPTDTAKISLNGGNIFVNSLYDYWGQNQEKKENEQSVFSGIPTAQSNKDGLYPVILTVKELFDETNVSGAKITIPVKPTNGVNYNYVAETDTKGQAILWLPEGDYTMTGQSVTHAIGSMPDGTSVTVSVSADAVNQHEVWIGSTFSLSLTPDTKVYNTTVDIKADMSQVQGTITSIRWFRVPTTDTQEYKNKEDLATGIKAFEAGYTAASSDNKGSIDNPTLDNNTYPISANQNGRYWVEVKATDATRTGVMVRDITVKSIFTSFPIEVRTRELTREGTEKYTTQYESLKTALGTEYTVDYGFAWELDGQATKTLVSDPTGGYDTVPVSALTTKVKWYNAAFGVRSTSMSKNADKTAFEPIELTLDQTFLTNNQDADKVNNQTDISKYTITYTPEGVPVAEITIRGIVLNGDGSEKEELWSYENSYPEGVTEATIDGFVQAGYRIEKVLVNGTERQGLSGNSIHLTDLQGTQANNYTDAINKVEFVYVSNMTDVTIHGYLQGTTDKVFGDRTVSAELGKPFTYAQPVIEGYDNVGSDPAGGTIDNVTAGAAITFYYLRSNGNVTYQAVDADDNTPLASKTESVANGGTVEKSEQKANAVFGTIQYYTLQGAGATTADTYNGKDDVTVTYQYARNTHKLTIVKKDIDSGNEITRERQDITDVPAGKPYAFGDKVTGISGYTAVAALNPISHTMGDADESVTFWYRKNDANRYATITVNSICDGVTFQSHEIPAFKDVALTVPAPTWKGYKLAANEQSSQTIIPTGTNDVVKFTYEIDNPKTVKVVLQDNSDANNITQLPIPSGYTESYTLKEGDTVEIWAPSVDGYTLMSASLNDAPKQTKGYVQLEYADIQDSNTVKFEYSPVSQANFVTHTVKFMVGSSLLYQYEKMIQKGNGAQVVYLPDDVKYTLPGYAYNNISYEVDGVQNPTEKDVTDAVNATITYHFAEDAATITIKKVNSSNDTPITADGSGNLVADTVLTGYRKGQTVQVVAPDIPGYALDDNLIKETELKDATAEVTFKYAAKGKITFTLKELVDGTPRIIEVINAKENTTYNPNESGNALDLSQYGYTFTTDADKVGSDVSDVFKADGDKRVEVKDLTQTQDYILYYAKNTRKVTFVPVDKTKLDAAGTTLDDAIKNGIDDYVITSLNPVEPEAARVGESYKAVAQSFNGWTLKDDFSKIYKVDPSSDPLKVYFQYEPKTTGTVTVQYRFGTQNNPGTLLNAYSFTAAAGEKAVVNAPEYLMDNKYHLRDSNTTPYELTVMENGTTVDFYYEANFITVTVSTSMDGSTPSKYEEHEVTKDVTTKNGSVTLYPPDRAGYTLVGITATGVTLTDGAADKLPTEYANNALTLSNLDKDATVTYHYKTTHASQFQTKLTVKYVYNGYALADDKEISVNTDEANAIDIPTFDGYTADTYQFTDGANVGAATSVTGGISITPTQDTGTLTINYVRPDGSVVLPGKDGKFPAPDNDKDNVIVTPEDPNTKLDPNPGPDPAKGSVTIPTDTTGTVTRPDPDNKDEKEDVIVPGGTTIDPDGTIHLPKNPDGTGGGDIQPGGKIPGSLPSGYVAITYYSNNSANEVKKEIGKAGELAVKGSLFTDPSGANFTGWNDSGSGNGNSYTQGTTVSDNTTLYAVWNASYTYSATIVYKPNDGTQNRDVTQTVGHNTDPNMKKTT